MFIRMMCSQKTLPFVTLSVLRILMGWVLFTEGTGKLLGWFHGQGITATRMFYDQLHVPFSPHHAPIIATIESVCGLLFLLGFMTRLAAIPVGVTMAGAAYIVGSLSGDVHQSHLLGLGLCALFFEAGSGPLSIDAMMCASKNNK